MGKIIKGVFAKPTSATMKNAPINEEQIRQILNAGSAISKMESGVKEALVDLAIEMAARIVHKTIEKDPAILDGIYANVLELGRDMASATVVVHPEDRAGSNVDAMAKKRGFQVIEDCSVGRGGCRLTAYGQEVDAALDSVLNAYRDTIVGKRHV